MAEIEKQSIHIIRELRTAIKEMGSKVAAMDEKMDSGFTDIRSRMDSLRQAINGESVLGRYAASEVEERLEALETRVARLEKTS